MAQWIARSPPKAKVVGSSPIWCALLLSGILFVLQILFLLRNYGFLVFVYSVLLPSIYICRCYAY